MSKHLPLIPTLDLLISRARAQHDIISETELLHVKEVCREMLSTLEYTRTRLIRHRLGHNELDGVLNLAEGKDIYDDRD